MKKLLIIILILKIYNLNAADSWVITFLYDETYLRVECENQFSSLIKQHPELEKIFHYIGITQHNILKIEFRTIPSEHYIFYFKQDDKYFAASIYKDQTKIYHCSQSKKLAKETEVQIKYKFYLANYPELIELFNKKGITEENVVNITFCPINAYLDIVFKKDNSNFNAIFFQNTVTRKYDNSFESESPKESTDWCILM